MTFYSSDQLLEPGFSAQKEAAGFRLYEPLPLSTFIISIFVIAAISVSLLPGFNYLVIGLGCISAAAFLFASLRSGFFVPTEIKLFFVFFVLSGLGLFIAKYPPFFLERVRTLVQLLLMAVIIAYYARNTRTTSLLLSSAFLGIMIIGAAAIITGEYQRAEVEGEAERLGGIALNANAFAIATLYGMAILLYFFRSFRWLPVRILLIGGLLIAMRFIIASGSRKGFMAAVLLVGTWFLLSYGSQFRTRPFLVLIMLAGLAGLGAYTIYALQDTALLQRLIRLEHLGGTGEGSALSRFVMIKEGINLTFTHPLLGIGLNHFPFYSVTEKYAHNNYVEIFATTGIPAGICYHLIYILILYRLHKVGKYPLNPAQKNMVICFKGIILITLFLDLGIVSYYIKITWVFLALTIGYLNYLQRDLAARYDQFDANDSYAIQNEQDCL